ncbi:MAG: DUF2007 domain-containing protein [Bacteroidales bacterium]|nr:DUF2007 domain-containing protein [Bacteroidales bacterium]
MLEKQWILVFSSGDLFKAELLKGLLSEHGIESVVVNKKDSAYLIGDVELFVTVENAFEANQIIKASEI